MRSNDTGREYRLSVRLTALEYERLRSVAETYHVTTSVALRAAVRRLCDANEKTTQDHPQPRSAGAGAAQ